MKRDDLKQTLKPLIKECIKEVIFDDGVLSGIITEIVKGLDSRILVTESAAPRQTAVESVDQAEQERQHMVKQARHEHRQQMETQRRTLSESLSGRLNGVDIFEGVNPLAKAGQPSSGPTAPSSPLEGVDPEDPGVDISKLGVF